jgi:hypothetical protein
MIPVARGSSGMRVDTGGDSLAQSISDAYALLSPTGAPAYAAFVRMATASLCDASPAGGGGGVSRRRAAAAAATATAYHAAAAVPQPPPPTRVCERQLHARAEYGAWLDAMTPPFGAGGGGARGTACVLCGCAATACVTFPCRCGGARTPNRYCHACVSAWCHAEAERALADGAGHVCATAVRGPLAATRSRCPTCREAFTFARIVRHNMRAPSPPPPLAAASARRPA